jgi:hypothetical protein
MKAAMAVIANVHHPPARGTTAIENVEFPQTKVRIVGPSVRHPAGLHAMLKLPISTPHSRLHAKEPRS